MRIVSAGLLLTLAFAAQSSLFSLHAHATNRAAGSAGAEIALRVADDDRAIDSSDGHCQACEVARRLGADGRALLAGATVLDLVRIGQSPSRAASPRVPKRPDVGRPSRAPPLASA